MENLSVKANATRIARNAADMAAKMAGDTDANADVSRFLEAKLDVSLGPVWFYASLMSLYKTEELNSTPVPLSPLYIKDDTGREIRQNNADEYEAPKADGSAGVVKRYWHWDFADALPEGQALQAKLKQAKAIRDTNEAQADLIERNANKRLGNLRKLVAQGFAIYHQRTAMAGYEGAEMVFVTEKVPVYVTNDEGENVTDDKGAYIHAKDDKGRPRFETVNARTDTPCRIQNTEKDADGKVEMKFKDLSVVQFLGLDVKAATEKGGGYDNLIGTLRRGADEGDEDDDVSQIIEGVEGFADYATAIANFLDDDDKYAALKKAVAKRSPGNDDLLYNLSNLRAAIGRIIDGVPNAKQVLAEIDGRKQAA